MDTSLIFSTLFEIHFNDAFVRVRFRDSDGRRRATVGDLIREAFPNVPRNGRAIFVTAEWESSQGWSGVATDYASTRVIRDTKYRLRFFNRDLRREVPHKFAMIWEPIGGERMDLDMYSQANDHVILLLGSRNSGKTNFLNDLPSYLRFLDYGSFMQCTDCDVPSPSQPKTMECDLHIFTFKGNLFSFIDTPGIPDSRCIENDRLHMDTVLKALTVLPHVNTVCFAFNSFGENAEETIRQKIHFAFSNLPKEIAKNVFFLFNKSFSKRTPAVLLLLERVLEELSDLNGVQIPFHKENVFFFENAASLAWHLHRKAILNERLYEDYGSSWVKSRDSALGLLSDLKTSPPIAVHFFEFVRQNRKKLNAAMGKILLIRSKSPNTAEKRLILQKEEDSLKDRCIECIHFLSRHSIVDRNSFLPGYIQYLTSRYVICDHLAQFGKKFELEARLWDEANASADWELSFFVSKRSISGSIDRLMSQESIFTSLPREEIA